MSRSVFVLAAAAFCLSFAARSQASVVAIPGLYNTVVNASGVPLPDGTIGDPHYTLIAVPIGSTQTLRVRTSVGGWPIGPYIGDDNLSTWIGPDDTADLTGSAGDYVYETQFNLPTTCVLSTASITGVWAADNEEIAIYLNNNVVVEPPIATVPSGEYVEDFHNWSSFTITSGFQTGINTLDFVVYNEPYNPPSSVDNPTALRVEMTGTVDPVAVPEPVSMIFFGTGLVAVGGYMARRRMLRKA